MMNNRNDFFDELSQSLSENNKQLQVIKSDVPFDKQLEFFKIVKRLNTLDLPSIEEQIELLGKSELIEREENVVLASLAMSCDVKAFRALEEHRKLHPGDFANMAYMHANMMLQSEFSDSKLIFISTGMGGKGNNLRYAALFKSNRQETFSAYQRDLIEKEIPYYINRHEGEVEEIEIGDNYFTLVFLHEFNGDVKVLLENAAGECNQFGDFIDNNFILTNIKRFSQEEIEQLLSKENEKDNTDTDD
ncbi:MAG: hypothetical protein LBS54_08995 [Dysgonamonadaceae bacterium]|jgi:hypothetical protein|nr:hypothetical protein [Dysgonamonadaceae bacterium]